MRSLRFLLPAGLALALLAAPEAAPRSTAGQVDPTFGRVGSVLTDIAGGDDTANGIALQAGRRIVLGGTSVVGDKAVDFALARFTSEGVPDPSFGRRGQVTTDVSTGDVFRAVGTLRDGKILGAGTTGQPASQDFALLRYQPNGALDPPFGASGKVRTSFGSAEQAAAMAVQRDGKIVVVGHYGHPRADFALARYEPDGTLDPTFGDQGRVITDFGGFDYARAVAVQSDGKIVVGGFTSNIHSEFALARYLPNGVLDTGFGKGGRVVTSFGPGEDEINDLAVLKDGKIVAAGRISTGGESDFGLARFLPSGQPDVKFAFDGKQTTDFGGADDVANAMIVLPDGRIILAGRGQGRRQQHFAVARYHANGARDDRFGSGGKAVIPVGVRDSGATAAVLERGKLLLGGFAHSGKSRDFALVRVNL